MNGSRARRLLFSWIWVIFTALALWWPSRVSGPLDGVPLDRVDDAILLGVVFPALCWFHRSFLNDRRARALVVALLAWKIFGQPGPRPVSDSSINSSVGDRRAHLDSEAG